MREYRLRVLGGLQLVALVDDDECAVSVQPKPLALLAFVALFGREMPVRRDTILALFWPELPTEQARIALRQALFHLRRMIGGDVLVARGDDTLALASTLSCDAVELDAALARGDAGAAAALYTGALFNGVHIRAASPELDQRLSSERTRLTCVVTQAVWSLAVAAEDRGDQAAAAQWAHRALALSPDDEDLLQRVALLLERVGARDAGKQVLALYVQRLFDEWGDEPSAEIRGLLARLDAPSAVESRESLAESSSLLARGVGEPIAPAMAPRAAHNRWRSLVWATGAIAASAVMAIGIHRAFDRTLGSASFTTGGLIGLDTSVAIRSAVARGLYAEATVQLSANHSEQASQLFWAAARQDSTCTVCWRRAGEALLAGDPFQARMFIRRAATSPSGPLRERLLSMFRWRAMADDPSQLAISDSLVSALPSDVDAQLAHANAMITAGRSLDVITRLRSLAAADSAGTAEKSGTNCPVCNVWPVLIAALWTSDSVSAATDVARTWARRHPADEAAWWQLFEALCHEGRYAEARATLARFAPMVSNDAKVLLARARVDIREGRYDSGIELLEPLERFGTSARIDAYWWHAIALRSEGRPAQALALTTGPMRRGAEEDPPRHSYGAGLMEAQLLFESGRLREAAELFRSVAARVNAADSGMVATIARKRAWSLVHAGTALATMRDTISLIALIDSVQATGEQSSLARDHGLHHYLRGLLWCIRDQPDSAERALRASLVSLAQDFTRENAELAALLIRLHRAPEAIPLARLAMQGPVEASNNFVTRTELRALLAEAYSATGDLDSASVYRDAVRHAWRTGKAPPPLICSAREHLPGT